MLRILIPEIQKHRNETTFRPQLQSTDLFREVGIEFVFEGNKWDMAWIGQASYMDKTNSLQESVVGGLKYLEQFEGKDYILFDGQDSATLKGSVEVFNNSSARFLLKNTLYKELATYFKPLTTGRIYWNKGEVRDFYRVSIDQDFSKIRLSGTNWLSGVNFNNFTYKHATKDIDVFAMFQYPGRENWEWEINTSKYYTAHRKRCINALKKLPDHIKVVTAETGNVPLQEYYSLMSRSKIVIAPFGYGEIAPRDLEAAMVGAILIKPDMSHIQTLPNIYNDYGSYRACRWDYEDLVQIILYLVSDFKYQQEYHVEEMRTQYFSEYTSERMITHIYNLIKEIPGYC